MLLSVNKIYKKKKLSSSSWQIIKFESLTLSCFISQDFFTLEVANLYYEYNILISKIDRSNVT